VHFGTWLTSLELTSVAASVTLVTTAPLFVALLLTVTGRRPGPATWLALGLAAVGSAVITGGDALDPGAWEGTALEGDALALVGALAMAVYLVVGDRLRASLSTAAYAGPTYTVAAGGLALLMLVGPARFGGYDTKTWLAIGAMILGPQLTGHTVLNHLLERLGSVSVSLALLLEPVGAAILVWLLFDEVPPLAAWIGGPLVMAALAVQINGERRRDVGEPGSGR
jgi:drug/metabolite transporter (DMT)-like permease